MYLSATQHLNIMGVGGAVFIIFGLGVLGEYTGGWVTDHLRQKGYRANTVIHATLLMAGLVATVSMYLLTSASSVVTAVAFLCVAMFCLSAAGALFWGMPAAISQRKDVGVVAGTMNFVGNCGGIATPILIGLIVQATGSYFWALMMFLIFCVAMGLFPLLVDVENKVGNQKLVPVAKVEA
jgi:ACS family D-galactonate transporter-like MFS transporter